MNHCYRVLLPGEPMQETFQGLSVTNTQVLPHPVTAALETSDERSRSDAWLFVGRISPEKGLVDLLRLWPSNQSLEVVGDGPDRQQAEGITRERNLPVKFLGSQASHEVRSLMSSSRGLIFPSKALEGAPLVYGEAMQSGLPLVAADGSTLATQTLADHTGAIFTWDDPSSVTTALDFVAENRAELASRAEEVYTSRYTPEVWINIVTDIYRAAISAHRST
jgi:glycosyltransferase involved in cell wall biosynthesis